MTYTAVQVGTGGRGAVWCRRLLQPHVEDDRLEVVAAVDVDDDALEKARDSDGLDLPEERCYGDVVTTIEAHEPDICFVAVPSAVHEEVVTTAAAHGVDVLCEKPIADTMAASARIAERVERAGVRMGVMFNHRFDRDKVTLRRRVRADESGPLDYLVYRFTCDCREYGDWGAEWKYAMDEPLLVGGAVHHLDILMGLADAEPERVYARTWNPRWSDFAGNAQALVTVTFANGVEAVYEGAKANAVGLNGWGTDYIRAECRDATLELDRRELTRYDHDLDAGPDWEGAPAGERVPLNEGDRWRGVRIVEQFLDCSTAATRCRRGSSRRSVPRRSCSPRPRAVGPGSPWTCLHTSSAPGRRPRTTRCDRWRRRRYWWLFHAPVLRSGHVDRGIRDPGR